MVNYEEISYKKYGKCIKIDNGKIELIITLDIGPRVIRFSEIGGENVFFEDEELRINHDDKKAIYAEKLGEEYGTWATIGGHRLWASPEALPRTYFVNARSDYEKIENGVRIKTPVQPWADLRPEMDIIISGENTVKTVHRLENCGAWPIEFAPWAITVMAQGGTEIIPQPKRSTGLLKNRLIALWDYTEMGDERVSWGTNYIKLRQNPNVKNAFKLGIDSEHGFAMYFNSGNLFVKKFDIVENGSYPDGGMSFESYTNGDILEIESLGEIKKVGSGEISEHTEYWSLYGGVDLPETDADIDKAVKKYV